MTGTSDDPHECSGDVTAPSAETEHAESPRPSASQSRRILVVDADRALVGLLGEWLVDEDCALVEERPVGGDAVERYDLIIVDVPFPREGGAEALRRIARGNPATPVLALSSAFFGGVGCRGPIARALGVTCVLPKTASRETLTRVVSELLSG